MILHLKNYWYKGTYMVAAMQQIAFTLGTWRLGMIWWLDVGTFAILKVDIDELL